MRIPPVIKLVCPVSVGLRVGLGTQTPRKYNTVYEESDKYIRLKRKRKKSASQSFGNERMLIFFHKTRSHLHPIHKGK